MADKPTIRRKYISLDEDIKEDWTLTEHIIVPTGWSAILDGPLSTGENVHLFRSAASAGEALLLLEEAIKAEGWTIRDR